MNTTQQSVIVAAALKVAPQFEELAAEEISFATTEEASLSHQTSRQLPYELVQAAMTSSAAIPALMEDLQRLIFIAHNMTDRNGFKHPHSQVLVRLYGILSGQANANRNSRTPKWDEFLNHQIDTTPYYGKLSTYDQTIALRSGGFSVLSAKVENAARIYSTRTGWIVNINGDKIQVPAEQIFRLLATCDRTTLQSAPWEPSGTMFNSPNFDGWTMVVRPRSGATKVSIANMEGEVLQFDEIRLSCPFWIYVTMLQMVVSGRYPKIEGAQQREFLFLRKINEEVFGSTVHLCANTAELTYARFVITMRRNPSKDYFKSGMLRDYRPEHLVSFEAFLPRYELVTEQRVSAARARKQTSAPIEVPDVEYDEEEEVI